MLTCYLEEHGRLSPSSDTAALDAPNMMWIDLNSPDEEERQRVEAHTGLAIPTLAEMQEIEASSRLYSEDGALFMTAPLVAQVEAGDPVSAPVTFIVAPGVFVTLRHTDPKAFRLFAQQAHRSNLPDTHPHGIFLSLLETIVDRFADVLELISGDADRISNEVFHADELADERPLEVLLKATGRCGELTSKLRESIGACLRLLTWFGHPQNGYIRDEGVRERIRTLGRDLASLGDHTDFQTSKIQFLLDATLGRINIEQTKTIKIFSVAAAAFLPPTLIASIYGMNFRHMPELEWTLGYPLAIGAMLLSAVLPLWYFKRKGWL